MLFITKPQPTIGQFRKWQNHPLNFNPNNDFRIDFWPFVAFDEEFPQANLSKLEAWPIGEKQAKICKKVFQIAFSKSIKLLVMLLLQRHVNDGLQSCTLSVVYTEGKSGYVHIFNSGFLCHSRHAMCIQLRFIAFITFLVRYFLKD